MKKIIVAIDGYSACGKSTTAKAVARQLAYSYVDSGAMYRATTLFFLQNQINIAEVKQVDNALKAIHIEFVFDEKEQVSHTHLNGLNVEQEIRKMYVSDKVSEVSALPQVRNAMRYNQQKLGSLRGIVMDGRDIGTVVFPDAELKIFMIASMEVRVQRRLLELQQKNEQATAAQIQENLLHRDHLDTHRSENPLRKASDAFELDTSHISFDEQVDFILKLAHQKIYATV
ncbi:MAG TPA: (d)CMP kinase [Microscillaceae bacterium]|jgi:cytidylate kinase|nr:(d)CMP kinase [Microscillaceae bacterium]